MVPREKYPLGQTVTRVNEQRERTQMWSRRYLEEQLLTVLAGAPRGTPLDGRLGACFGCAAGPWLRLGSN